MFINYWASGNAPKIFETDFHIDNRWLNASDCVWLVPGTGE